MKCLDATYRYSLEGTLDAYAEARRHQQQWLGLGTEAEIITEIPRLIALSFQHPDAAANLFTQRDETLHKFILLIANISYQIIR